MTTMKYPTWDEQMTAWDEFIKGSFGAEWKAPMIGPEMPTFMGLPHVTRPDELKCVDAVIIGAPYVAGSKVTAEVLKQGRGTKVKIIKFNRRKHSQKRQGHRQWFTEVKITAIKA